MNTSLHPRTRSFSRVLGPFLVGIAVAAAVRAADMRALLADFGANDVWPWVTGAFILLGGIAIVAFHQYWRGGAAIIVSVLGWLLVLRGLFLLFFPHTLMSLANHMIGATAVWQVVYIVMAIIGLYLTYVGWTGAPDRRATQVPTSTTNLPRAA
jgi:hypothetical protein